MQVQCLILVALGVGNIDGLDDNNGRLRLLFAEEDEGIGSQICKVEWSPDDEIRLDYTIIWNGGLPYLKSSWNISTTSTPGFV